MGNVCEPWIDRHLVQWEKPTSCSMNCDWINYRTNTLGQGVCKLWALMSDDLKWNWYNNNKAYNKCNVLESFWNYFPSPVHGKLSSTKLVTSAKKVWDDCSRITEEKFPRKWASGTRRDHRQQKQCKKQNSYLQASVEIWEFNLITKRA